MSDSLWSQGLQHARFPCLSLSPGVCSDSCWVSDAIHPSRPLSPSSSSALNLSQHQGLFQYWCLKTISSLSFSLGAYAWCLQEHWLTGHPEVKSRNPWTLLGCQRPRPMNVVNLVSCPLARLCPILLSLPALPLLSLAFCVLCCRLIAKSCLSDSLVTPWIVVYQAPLSVGFPRQKYQSGLPFPFLGHLLTQGLNPHRLHGRQILYHWTTREVLLKLLTCSTVIGVWRKDQQSSWENSS